MRKCEMYHVSLSTSIRVFCLNGPIANHKGTYTGVKTECLVRFIKVVVSLLLYQGNQQTIRN